MIINNSNIIFQTLLNSFQFSIIVFKIFPPVLILMGLLDAWVPREKIIQHLEVTSGLKGVMLSLLIGSVAAGPLFAAFPIAQSLSDKGVRTSNTVIFLGAWATIKVPMLIMESSFLGARFAILRLVITVPFIILIGNLVERFGSIEKP